MSSLGASAHPFPHDAGQAEGSPVKGASIGIKRRAVKVRQIRQHDDFSTSERNAEASSSPGAGPSRSPSPAKRRRMSRDDQDDGDDSSGPGGGGATLAPAIPYTAGDTSTVTQARSPRDPATTSAQSLTKPPTRPPPRHPRSVPRSALAPPRSAHPPLLPCRSVYSYTRLNHIEEGTYGVVFRAKCNDTNQIFALKKLKLEEEKQGFPITSLREVMALMVAGEHANVVGVREVVVGETLNQIFIVMPFIEHDLKTLLADMPHPFLQSEIKTIMSQLLSAVEFCHSNWILHRDLKTSNLLFTNRGHLKVADFGLARKFGDPQPAGSLTQLVVTLWYRAPELLLGSKAYSTAVDMWSVGCIFGELMQGTAILQGRGEIDQISKIFSLLGQPNDDVWPGYSALPLTKSLNPIGSPFSLLRQQFKQLSSEGHNLLAGLLMFDPDRRLPAEEAGRHTYFKENPLPKHPDLFPSFPSQAAGERRHRALKSPPAPGHAPRRDVEDEDEVDVRHGGAMDLESFV